MGLAERGISSDPELTFDAVHTRIALDFGPHYRKRIVEELDHLGLVPGHRAVFSPKPFTHRESGSEAVYIGKFRIGDDFVLISYLGRGARTSEHEHPKEITAEEYYPVDSEPHIYRNGKVVVSNGRVDIYPGEAHQVFAEEPVLLVIVMRGAGRIPEDKWHIRRPIFVVDESVDPCLLLD